MNHREFITEWFPFTVDELAIAFGAMEMDPQNARSAAEALAIDLRGANLERGFGWSEVGDFLGPIASLSDEHRARVERFRGSWGRPSADVFWDEPPDGSET